MGVKGPWDLSMKSLECHIKEEYWMPIGVEEFI
jgi:hypothetical protein